jgi:hypothetical protein
VQITVQGNRINSIQYETAACLIPDGRHDLFLTSHWREPFGADLSELEQHTYYTIANRMAGKHRDDTNTVYVTLTDAAALFTRQQHERDAARKDAEYWRNLVAAHVAAKGGPTLK